MLEDGECRLVADVEDLEQAGAPDLSGACRRFLERAPRRLIRRERGVKELHQDRSIQDAVAREPDGPERADPLVPLQRVTLTEDVARRRWGSLGGH